MDRTDKIRLMFEDELRFLLRWVGAEPVARRYAETTAEADLEVLLGYGREFALS